jgi:DNA invertase Pin-like site-specific DNA recombinase
VSSFRCWCDARSEVGRLMLTIMGGIAEFERGLIRKRCEEGIAGQAQGHKVRATNCIRSRRETDDCRPLPKGASIVELAQEYKLGAGTIWRSLQPAKKRRGK